jgi:hypothetical protein
MTEREYSYARTDKSTGDVPTPGTCYRHMKHCAFVTNRDELLAYFLYIIRNYRHAMVIPVALSPNIVNQVIYFH